jgi:GT2 family glycosyltransferase
MSGAKRLTCYDRRVTVGAAAARVAVVIVNYQSYPELRACLESLGPLPADVRCVVVDHHTRAPEAAALSAAFGDVQFLASDANPGFAAGVNRGTRASDSTYILLLNPDSIASPELAGSLAAWMDANPRVGAVGPRIRNRDGTVQASARRFPDLTTAVAGRSSWLTRVFPNNPLSRHNLDPATREEPTDVDWVSGACVLIRRQAFEEVGGMDEGFFLYWEDADFCRRLARAGWRVVYQPRWSVLHTGGGSSRHAADASLVAFHDSAYRLFRKHASATTRLLSPVVYAALRARLAFMRRLVRVRGY